MAWLFAPEAGRAAGEPAMVAADGLFQALAPEKNHETTLREVVKVITDKGYRHLSVDDGLSQLLWQRYLGELDRQRMYLTAADIAELAALRYELDDALRSGDMGPAFAIFNRYQKRLTQRFTFVLREVENGLEKLDLEKDDALEIDRQQAPWPASDQDLQRLWHKHFKNDVLNLKLAGKSLSQIQPLLERRYRSQLNRIRQTSAEDVFSMFVNSLARLHDPHTQYFSPRFSEDFNIRMSLSLEGIGAVLQTDNEHTKVMRLIPAGPADKSKQLAPGDRIVGVGQGEDGDVVNIIGWRIDEVVRLIRGPKETVVRLEVLPVSQVDESQTRMVSITRNTVKLEEQAARSKVITHEHQGRTLRIGVVQIPTFYADLQAMSANRKDYRSTTRDTRQLMDELKSAGIDGLVIDLRNNVGGSLQEASDLTGLFIKSGPTVQIRETQGRTSHLEDRDPRMIYRGPLVIMVNRLSASAAEIFAGAIQDYGVGLVLGTTTFGKGTVQGLLNLGHGQLKLTQAKFYRVSGDSTQHKGVVPDILFPADHDPDKIGESALPDAQPWDRIDPAAYKAQADLKPLIPILSKRHEERMATAPDFVFIRENLAAQRQAQQKKQLSLRESTRRQERLVQEREQLQRENKRRTAKGLAPIEKIEKTAADDIQDPDPKAPDPYLEESGNILIDYIDAARNAAAVH
jgi:carboxyl-terminal processing protease